MPGRQSLSNFHVGIVDGKIALSFPGMAAEDDPHLFDDEGAASECLAKAMIERGHFHLLTSSSCDFPGEDGRPDFDMDRFNELIRQKLRVLVSSPGK